MAACQISFLNDTPCKSLIRRKVYFSNSTLQGKYSHKISWEYVNYSPSYSSRKPFLTSFPVSKNFPLFGAAPAPTGIEGGWKGLKPFGYHIVKLNFMFRWNLSPLGRWRGGKVNVKIYFYTKNFQKFFGKNWPDQFWWYVFRGYLWPISTPGKNLIRILFLWWAGHPLEFFVIMGV